MLALSDGWTARIKERLQRSMAFAFEFFSNLQLMAGRVPCNIITPLIKKKDTEDSVLFMALFLSRFEADTRHCFEI